MTPKPPPRSPRRLPEVLKGAVGHSSRKIAYTRLDHEKQGVIEGRAKPSLPTLAWLKRPDVP